MPKYGMHPGLASIWDELLELRGDSHGSLE